MPVPTRSGGHFTSEESLDRKRLDALQGTRLAALLREVLPRNPFYARKLSACGLSPPDAAALTREDLRRLPFTTKAEVQADQDQHPPYGTNLTYPLDRYVRMHQTSGTSGRPLRWLDTAESWATLLSAWGTIYRAAGLGASERVFVPFSFGPFLGFWAGFEGALRMGMMALPGGGMTSAGRLRFIIENGVTVLLATPTYALRLLEAAREEGLDVSRGPVRALILAGEPGASIPAVRERIESGFGARCFDHWGMTEVGPLAFEAAEDPSHLLLLETQCIPEVIDPRSGEPVAPGALGELCITTLNRPGSPLVRYRTGDLVSCALALSPSGRSFLRLEGGVLGRVDDMMLVKGNNVYPSAVDSVLRGIKHLAEYQAVVRKDGAAVSAFLLRVEPCGGAEAPLLLEEVRRAFQDAFFFRPDVEVVAPGALPRFEMKARRFVEETGR